MRLGAGGVEEDFALPEGGFVAVRYERSDHGWRAEFTVRTPGVDDLAVVHRLIAPTLAEARRLVPAAVAFLRGEPVDPARLP
jgi:hypothetical protein